MSEFDEKVREPQPAFRGSVNIYGPRKHAKVPS